MELLTSCPGIWISEPPVAVIVSVAVLLSVSYTPRPETVLHSPTLMLGVNDCLISGAA